MRQNAPTDISVSKHFPRVVPKPRKGEATPSMTNPSTAYATKQL